MRVKIIAERLHRVPKGIDQNSPVQIMPRNMEFEELTTLELKILDGIMNVPSIIIESKFLPEGYKLGDEYGLEFVKATPSTLERIEPLDLTGGDDFLDY